MKYLSLVLLLLVGSVACAAEALHANAKVKSLSVTPPGITLTGPFAYTQLLVSATTETGEVLDVTRMAKFTPPTNVKLSPTGLLRPTADGTGEMKIEFAGVTTTVKITATDFATKAPVSFVKDVQPTLSKMGCNQGTCHGSAQGKNGFKLSLRGYDPIYDHRALTDDLEGRRFNRAAPERSLMMMKPEGGVPHAGGGLWTKDDLSYKLVNRWISEGVKLDLTTTRVKSLELSPAVVNVGQIGLKQQYRVVATYTDGSTRDVTAEAFIDSSNTDVATIDKTGLLSTVRRGEATMLARYDGAYSAASVVVMGDRSGFTWVQQPVLSHIDDLVDVKLKKLKIAASGLCTDEEFLRRVTLDLIGLPPVAADVRAFLADARPSREKREAMIDKLIGSEEYIDHWTNKWGDMLQVNRKFLGDMGAKALRDWIRNAIAKNTPYDQFAYSVMTASGSNVDQPPASYYKVLREADAVMENTTQLFLAIRFNCNKCHDHPFEKWTQDQYFETSAFFAQVGRAEDPKYKGQKIGGTAVEGAKPLVEVISDAKGGEIKHDRTGQTAVPKFPFNHAGYTDEKDSPRRVKFGKWLTSAQNPYFAKSYVNRIWSYMTGMGIIEPVDDIRAGNPASNPQLLDKLTTDFIASGFDTRKLIQTICKSRTYQLSLQANKFNKDDDANYSHALPRRLPAEVLFDAIHMAAGAKSRLPGLPVGARAAQLIDSNVDLPGAFLELFGKPVRESACECERSNTMMLGPVLAMVNGPIVGDAIRDPNNSIVTFTEKEKDDAKVVEEIYLNVLCRKPTAKETEIGVGAIRSAGNDHKLLLAEHLKHKKAFDDYDAGINARLPDYEKTLKAQRPTEWTAIKPKTVKSAAGATADKLDKSSTTTINDDASVFVTGPKEQIDQYTLTYEVKQNEPLGGLRLEALMDDKLPAKGPGRADNGNIVLHELVVSTKGPKDGKEKPVKLKNAQATFSQATFEVAKAIDGNVGTGWALAPETGKSHTAIFAFDKPLDAKDGLTITIKLDQRFGTGHTLGKFRFSLTNDAKPKLNPTVAKDLLAIVDIPAEKRTPEQKQRMRNEYIGKDGEYRRLQMAIPMAPPSDPRSVGAQDLAWALMNTPAFLFNR